MIFLICSYATLTSIFFRPLFIMARYWLCILRPTGAFLSRAAPPLLRNYILPVAPRKQRLEPPRTFLESGNLSCSRRMMKISLPPAAV